MRSHGQIGCISERLSLRVGDWLAHPTSPASGSTFGGFFVLPTSTLPEQVATLAGLAELRLLLPVTVEELAQARETSVLSVAQRLFEEKGIFELR